MNEWDCVAAGFGGGVVGAYLVLSVMHYHWRRVTKQYTDAKNSLADVFMMLEMRDDIKKLKVEMAAANKAFYGNK